MNIEIAMSRVRLSY